MQRLRDKLKDDAAIMTAWSGHRDPIYLSTLARTGFDAITLDMQHGMQSEGSVITGIHAIAPTGKPVVVRIPVGRFEMASKALDAGAHMIIAPMVNTVEDAQALASFTKYPPLGDRSFGVSHTIQVLGDIKNTDYTSVANTATLAIAMIETRQALDNLDAILDVEGIDGVFCGPADLDISLRGEPKPVPFSKETLPHLKRIAEAARDRGKVPATLGTNVENCNLAHEMGYRFIAMGFDQIYLSQGADRMLSELNFRKAR